MKKKAFQCVQLPLYCTVLLSSSSPPLLPYSLYGTSIQDVKEIQSLIDLCSFKNLQKSKNLRYQS